LYRPLVPPLFPSFPTRRSSDRVFHYLPFNFAASWLLLLSCLTRETTLTLSTDLNKLAEEIRLSSPNYFLNVPTLLERVRRGVEEALSKRAAPIQTLFGKSREAWQHQNTGHASALDKSWLWLARKMIFDKIRERFGRDLRALICGSARSEERRVGKECRSRWWPGEWKERMRCG